MGKINFENLPSRNTPINAENLNTIQYDENYYLEEIDTGKIWIDGRTIYRKVIETQNLPNVSEIRINTGVNNIKMITKIEAITYQSDGGTQFPIPYIGGGTNNLIEIVYIGANNQFRITTTNDKSQHIAYIIFEYTKK